MNGFLIISLLNGMLLYSYSNNNYGLKKKQENNKNNKKERNENNNYEISSFLYAIYTLSKQIEDKKKDIKDNIQLNNELNENKSNENIVMGFNESPLLYFQQESIIWHFYESSGQNSDILILISCNYQIKHNYAYIFAANLSQIFISNNITVSLTPRGSITKQIMDDYYELLKSRMKELIEIFFLNIFQYSNSFCIVYRPINCISLISSYHHILRGEYMIDMDKKYENNLQNNINYENIENNNGCNNNSNNDNQLLLTPDSQIETTLIQQKQINTNIIDIEPIKTIQISQSNPNIQISQNILPTNSRPISAENNIFIQNKDEFLPISKKSNFISRSFEWVRKKLKFGKVSQIKNNSLNNQPTNIIMSPNEMKDEILIPKESNVLEEKLPQVEEIDDIKWNFFHNLTKINNLKSKILSDWAIPLLSNIIQQYNENYDHQIIKSNLNQNISEVISFHPFIFTTFLSLNPNLQQNLNENLNEINQTESEMKLNVINLSNSIYFTPTTFDSEVYLLWDENNHHDNNDNNNNNTLLESFESNLELKILFLEFLELQVQKYIS